MPIDENIIFIAVAAIAIILLTRGYMLRIRGKSALSSEDAADRIPSLKNHIEIKDKMQKLIVDLQGLARQINGQIDTRFCKLEVLIKEADDKIRQLEGLGLAGEHHERVDPEREMIYKLSAMGKSSVEIARELNKNTGEIELILSLRRSGAKGGAKIDYKIE